MADRLIFQLGTNNWQRDGEFAPGSGILHEAHHHAYNALPGVRAYSMYPSRRQRFRSEDVRVFELDHDIPICESVSPVSSYRWHSMSEAEVAAYRTAADRRGRRLDRRDRGGHRRHVRAGDRAPRVHEHRGDAGREPAPGRGRPPPDAAAVLRPRHRAEDVRQRAARRPAGGVPAAVPAVHAAGEDLRLRRPGPRRRRGRGDLGRAGRGVPRRVPGVPARAGAALPQRLQPGRLPAADRAHRRVRRPRAGAGRVHHPAAGGQRAARRSRSRRRTGSTRWSRSAGSSPTGSGWTRCCGRPRSTSSRTGGSSPW